jgi:hypothetical protein
MSNERLEALAALLEAAKGTAALPMVIAFVEGELS